MFPIIGLIAGLAGSGYANTPRPQPGSDAGEPTVLRSG
jgi:hypothetical protein